MILPSHDLLNSLKNIKSFFLDVDGIFTNNEIIITEAGEMLRTMNVKDGYAIKQAILNNYFIAIITGGKSEGVVKRMQFLGIEEIHCGIKDKLTVASELVQKYHLKWDEICYMGDDFPDLPVMKKVGFPICPADAIPEIQSICKYVSHLNGGQAFVRDVIEKILRLNQSWELDNLNISVS